MEDESFYSSIYMKIHGRPCLFIRSFHKNKASNSIPATLAFFNGVLQSHLGLPHQGSASSSITPMPSKSVRVPSKKLNAIDDLLWVTSTTITAPVNRVMVLMRCQNEMIKSGRLSYPYKGIADCFTRTVRNEGIISLWKGNSAHLMGIAIKKFLSGSALVYCLSLFNFKKEDGFWKKLNGLLAAYGVSTAAIFFFLAHPFEYASTRITNDIKTGSIFEKRQFNGIIDVFKKTIKSDGITGLYRGYKMVYFAYFVNDLLVLALTQYQLHEMLGLQHSVLAGVMVVTGRYLLVNLITHPMHTVVQRMMMRSGEAVQYTNSFDAFSQILKNEGVKSLYKGASAQFIRSAIIGGLIMIYLIISNENGSGRSGQPTYGINIKWWKKGEDVGKGSHS